MPKHLGAISSCCCSNWPFSPCTIIPCEWKGQDFQENEGSTPENMFGMITLKRRDQGLRHFLTCPAPAITAWAIDIGWPAIEAMLAAIEACTIAIECGGICCCCCCCCACCCWACCACCCCCWACTCCWACAINCCCCCATASCCCCSCCALEAATYCSCAVCCCCCCCCCCTGPLYCAMSALISSNEMSSGGWIIFELDPVVAISAGFFGSSCCCCGCCWGFPYAGKVGRGPWTGKFNGLFDFEAKL